MSELCHRLLVWMHRAEQHLQRWCATKTFVAVQHVAGVVTPSPLAALLVLPLLPLLPLLLLVLVVCWWLCSWCCCPSCCC